MNFINFRNKYEKIPVQEINDLSHKKPYVTVCIQTYNHAKFIEKCLQGILAQQTDFHFEILLADDDSKDGTKEICLKYAALHPKRIRLFLHSRKNNIKVGGSPSANFIALYNFYNAKGKYIAICEGDDFWTDPLKLQKQFDFMEENSKYSVCYHDYKIIDSDDRYINSDKASPLREDLSAKELTLAFRHPATLTIFFRNFVNQEIPPEITQVLALDVFLNSLLGLKGPGKYLDNILPSSYRIHNGGLWSEMDIEPKLKSKLNTYTHISDYFLRIGNNYIGQKFIKRKRKILLFLIFLSLKNLKLKPMISLIKNW